MPPVLTAAGRGEHEKSRGPEEPRPSCCCLGCASSLDGGDVSRLHALLTAFRLVGDLSAFLKGLKASTAYPAVVHEEVVASISRLDEAVALIVVEPLDRSLGHTL